jgi:hypothetical protein
MVRLMEYSYERGQQKSEPAYAELFPTILSADCVRGTSTEPAERARRTGSATALLVKSSFKCPGEAKTVAAKKSNEMIAIL